MARKSKRTPPSSPKRKKDAPSDADENDNHAGDANDDLAIFNTTAPCQYHRGHALNVWGLSLSSPTGATLFQAADVCLPHGSITGIVGTNGCGKSSLARVLAAGVLDGFPSNTNSTNSNTATGDFSVEYLAAGDDDDYGEELQNQNSNSTEELASWSMLPRAYIQSRIQNKIDKLRQTIEQLEARLEQDDDDTNDNSLTEEQLNETAEQLSELYEREESMVEAMERETDNAMQQIGLQPHAHKKLSQLSCGWRYKCRLIAALLTRADLMIIDEPSFLDANATSWLMDRLEQAAKSDNAIVILISHKEQLLQALCDRILHINSANQTLTTYNCAYESFRTALEADIQHSHSRLATRLDRSLPRRYPHSERQNQDRRRCT